jgi:hypothetical protein
MAYYLVPKQAIVGSTMISMGLLVPTDVQVYSMKKTGNVGDCEINFSAFALQNTI